MHVLATAGHVDHGKSTLVRALTGMEPDRWAEEQRRGMTIDLGFAWTTLPGGAEVAFVDVPGHQRFVPNMLAGVGPAPAVLFVVAADEGWCRQSAEHLAALDGLRVKHAVLAVTRSDLAAPGATVSAALEQLGRTSLGEVEAVAVSGRTGQGLAELRGALERLVARLPTPEVGGRVRMWVDRAFTVRGSGTVVTGTLGAGALHVGDELVLAPDGRRLRVRGLQTLGRRVESVEAVARVAVNLRGLDVADVRRGDALVREGDWRCTEVVDVRVDVRGDDRARLPRMLQLHIGSAAVAVGVRRLGDDTARLTLATPLPLQPGDRALLRDPGEQRIRGLVILDVAPEPLRRRGEAACRAAVLESLSDIPQPSSEVRRRGAVRRRDLAAWGLLRADAPAPDGTVASAGWLVSKEQWAQWQQQLQTAVADHMQRYPHGAGLPGEGARHAVGVPDAPLFQWLVADCPSVESSGGTLRIAGRGPDLTDDERAALDEVLRRLTTAPFAAPTDAELAELGLTAPVLAAAARHGMLLGLRDGIVVLPGAEERAVSRLALLSQPFSLGEAGHALQTSRRVALPLLERLDQLGYTRRVDDSHRVVMPRSSGE